MKKIVLLFYVFAPRSQRTVNQKKTFSAIADLLLNAFVWVAEITGM